MKFNNLQDVKDHPWTGRGDHDAFEALNAYVQTDAPIEDRAAAINYVYGTVYQAGGQDNRPASAIVAEYIREWCTDHDDW